MACLPNNWVLGVLVLILVVQVFERNLWVLGPLRYHVGAWGGVGDFGLYVLYTAVSGVWDLRLVAFAFRFQTSRHVIKQFCAGRSVQFASKSKTICTGSVSFCGSFSSWRVSTENQSGSGAALNEFLWTCAKSPAICCMGGILSLAS